MTTNDWLAISAGATFLLALAAFWAIWQNHRFRKEDRERERCARSSGELLKWTEEALRLFYLPHNDENKNEIYRGLTDLLRMGVAMAAAAIIVGPEFEGLTDRALSALIDYRAAVGTKEIKKQVITEFRTSFNGLELYLNLLRTWDFEYNAFIKDVRQHVKFPVYKHLETYEDE